MKWTKIPDHLVLEANGYSWTDEKSKTEDIDAEAKRFHLRYAYSTIYKNLYVDIIEDTDGDEKRTVFQTGVAAPPETFHLVVAALEKIFPTSNMMENNEITKLALLVDLVRDDSSTAAKEYLSDKKKLLQEGFSQLFAAYQYAREQDIQDGSITEKFENVVRVDFKSGKRAYKPEPDLLEQIRGAIDDLSEDDSPIIHGIGKPKP